MKRALILERIDVAREGNIRTEKKEGGDWRRDGEKKVYGTYVYVVFCSIKFHVSSL